MAITTINSLAIPAGTVVSADLTYPLTGFSSTGIDDNATSTAITIDSSQNVGIGTTSPSVGLELKETGNAEFKLSSVGDLAQILFTATDANGVGQLNFQDNGTNFQGGLAYYHNGDSMRFTTAGNERMRIDSSGNVGIGTTPSSWSAAFDAIDLGPYASFSADNDTTFVTNNAYYNGTNWIYKNSNLAGRYRQQQGFHVWDTAVSGTAGGTLTWSETMRIDASGNVGIGTTSPAVKLDVVAASGSAYVNINRNSQSAGEVGLSLYGGTSGINWSLYQPTSSNDIRFYGNGADRLTIDSSGNVGIGGSPTAFGGGFIVSQTTGSSGGYSLQSSGSVVTQIAADSTASVGYTGTRSNHAHVFTTNNTERMRIDASGNVGIGTSSPSEKLHVKTSAANTTMLVENSSSQARYAVDTDGPYIYALTSGDSALRVYGETTERMRIDSSGNLLVGTTSASAKLTIVQPSGADREVILAGIDGVSNGFQVRYISGAMQYVLTGLGTGTVSSSAGVLSASSDQNMKIADGCVDNALDKISALTPRYFYWKDENGNSDIDKGRQLGFFAQEVNKVVPEAAPEPRDDQNGWGVLDRSLVATLVKAIQEQQAMIEELKAEVAALKGA